VWSGSLPAGERARPVGSSALRIQPQVQLSNFNALGGSYEALPYSSHQLVNDLAGISERSG
jgi:hypothetical protein